MPRIFDNIHLRLLPDLQQAIRAAYRADFCVGYFNLRGWKELADEIDSWPGRRWALRAPAGGHATAAPG
jgi:hypothetical protein